MLLLVLLGVFVATVSLCMAAYAVVRDIGAVRAALFAPWLKRQERRRQAALREQLPEALDMLVTAMRAGYSFQTAVRFVGEEMPGPLGPDFVRLYEEQRLGIEPREALVALYERSGSTELKMFVTAVLIHRDNEGKLTDVLGTVAEIIRQRCDAGRRVDALAAQSKVAARTIVALPVLVFAAIAAIDSELVRPMLADTPGRVMLAYAAASVVIGYFVLTWTAKVDV
jgi:tight adherence protein B